MAKKRVERKWERRKKKNAGKKKEKRKPGSKKNVGEKKEQRELERKVKRIGSSREKKHCWI